MTQARSNQIINQTLGISLQTKRGLRNLSANIYDDTVNGAANSVAAGAGITAGVGTVITSSRTVVGPVITTQMFIDMTGLVTTTTDLDIIGYLTPVAYIAQITAAEHGTLFYGSMQCVEAPVTGVTDIDLYSATEATGAYDTVITNLAEVAVLTSGAAWTAGRLALFTSWPAAGKYLYLCNGAAGTVGTYTAGKFIITMKGTNS